MMKGKVSTAVRHGKVPFLLLKIIFFFFFKVMLFLYDYHVLMVQRISKNQKVNWGNITYSLKGMLMTMSTK